jgi:glycosyltransferase involved in cell wall biosynthesis
VAFAGEQGRAQALAWMVAADLVICPSRYEGMSLVPLEAAVLGRSVVASRVEGMDEGPAEPARTLVEAGNAAALSGVVIAALDHLRQERGERQAREWADATYSTRRSPGRCIELYAELCPSRFWLGVVP